MGFYIEELPTEFNGITMEEADYLADEFLKDEPCNRMWDAMRALRDFYETVMNEAVEVAKQTEPCDECVFVKGSGWCDNCNGKPKGLDALPNSRKAEQTEPQTNADQHVQHVGSVESVEPTWTKEEHEAFYTFLWNVINPNEMQDYIGMFEAKDEPQTERSE